MTDPQSSQPIPPFVNVATAPFVYFDSAPAFGVLGGAIEIELTARVLIPDFTGAPVKAEIVPTARLRCSPMAAMALAEAVNKSLEMLKQMQEQAGAPASAAGSGKLN